MATLLGGLLVSDASAGELVEVLQRPKFDKYADRYDRDAFLSSLLQLAVHVSINLEITACRDPKDNIILELAVSGNADYIITGDADLLVLNPFRGIAIVTPAEFLTFFAVH